MSIYKALLTCRKIKKKGKNTAEIGAITILEGLKLVYHQDSNLILWSHPHYN